MSLCTWRLWWSKCLFLLKMSSQLFVFLRFASVLHVSFNPQLLLRHSPLMVSSLKLFLINDLYSVLLVITRETLVQLVCAWIWRINHSCCYALSLMWCSHSQVDGANHSQTTPPSAVPPETPSSPAELDARLAQYERQTVEEEEERIPDLQKDDMMARRTGVFHKQSTAPGIYNRFLPLPASKRCTQGEVTTDAAPRSKREVLAERSKILNARWAEMCVSNSMRRL